MTPQNVSFQLVKMDGDFVPRSPWWNLPRRLMNKIRGTQEMPANPINDPRCAEILEGGSASDLRVVYRRD